MRRPTLVAPLLWAGLLTAPALAQNPASTTTSTGQLLEVEIVCEDVLDEADTSFTVDACATLGPPQGFFPTQIATITIAVNGNVVQLLQGPEPAQLCLTGVELLQYLDVNGVNFVEATAVTFDGTQVTAVKSVVKTACLLFVGLWSHDLPLGPDPTDRSYVAPLLWFSVTEAEVPTFEVPPLAELAGLEVFFQVGMHNQVVFPEDPLQTSNGVRVELGAGPTSYGTPNGIWSWLEGGTAPGESFEIRFDVLGT